ncbi:unnamed protein product [Pleuronectes platessa]|uniref:Uncharacterized protein n=1 Tax=Pleuronectes platessa TaxID=8262 RepID=A0A9N7UX98_PLEPL|nr:unnamed protein product [Pleuronectes platessa]
MVEAKCFLNLSELINFHIIIITIIIIIIIIIIITRHVGTEQYFTTTHKMVLKPEDRQLSPHSSPGPPSMRFHCLPPYGRICVGSVFDSRQLTASGYAEGFKLPSLILLHSTGVVFC